MPQAMELRAQNQETGTPQAMELRAQNQETGTPQAMELRAQNQETGTPQAMELRAQNTHEPIKTRTLHTCMLIVRNESQRLALETYE